jgi:hypothetical protein
MNLANELYPYCDNSYTSEYLKLVTVKHCQILELSAGMAIRGSLPDKI